MCRTILGIAISITVSKGAGVHGHDAPVPSEVVVLLLSAKPSSPPIGQTM
jgi:hypothetical protein